MAFQHLQELGDAFSPDAVEVLTSSLASGQDPTRLTLWLETLPPSPSATYLHAALATDLALPRAAEAWDRYFKRQSERKPLELLSYARALAAEGQISRAISELRLALFQKPDQTFFARAEKLIQQLAPLATDHLRKTRIAVIGESTTAFIIPILKALCLRDRINADFYEGLHGAQRQEVLDPESPLSRFKPDIVILISSWRHLNCPFKSDDPDTFCANFVAERMILWSKLAERFQCHVLQHGLDYPLINSSGPLGNKLPGGRSRMIERINRAMVDQAPGFVSILDSAELQRICGTIWEDAAQWARFQQHPASAALPAVAELQMAHIRAVLGLTRKVLVIDLDNTLWKGVIGEDGLNGIHVGPGSPAGEAHQELQRYLVELRQRGILLAVCSKNNPEDARLPFEKHPGMALRLGDFAAFRANWEDKAHNIRQVAAELSLGLESFVFLDDNPLEREWVRSQIPELTVVDPGPNIFHYVVNLDRGRYFDSLTVSEEDLRRDDLYRSESARENVRASYDSLEDFLRSLELEASVEPVDRSNLARVTQLINKTNQFNLTTRRYTEAQVMAAAEHAGGWAGAFRMSDRFGSHGLIGVILCRPQEPEMWEIDSWLMSCRILGRTCETLRPSRRHVRPRPSPAPRSADGALHV
jgi:FkbH-like protein